MRIRLWSSTLIVCPLFVLGCPVWVPETEDSFPQNVIPDHAVSIPLGAVVSDAVVGEETRYYSLETAPGTGYAVVAVRAAGRALRVPRYSSDLGHQIFAIGVSEGQTKGVSIVAESELECLVVGPRIMIATSISYALVVLGSPSVGTPATEGTKNSSILVPPRVVTLGQVGTRQTSY